MPTPWNEDGIKGCRRFLDKIWRMQEKVDGKIEYSKSLESVIHKTIKGVTEDLEAMKFNTAIAKMMSLVNEYSAVDSISRKDIEVLLMLLNPIAPHLAEEIWQKLGNAEPLVFHPWPTYDPEKLIESTVEIVVSINGKIRDRLVTMLGADETDLKEQAKALPRIKEMIGEQTIRKIIVIPNKLINIVL